jgi:hypothetical protein
MRGLFLLPFVGLSTLSARLPACSGETAPLVVAPHAVVRAEGRTVHVLHSDVCLTCADATCADARYLDGGAPPEEQAFSFSSDVDLPRCSDIVDAR